MYFLAYSRDPKVRAYSTSGGFTKELMAHALRSGFVDWLVFPRMRGVHAEVITTQSPAELFTPAANSVYDLVNPLTGLAAVPEGKTAAVTLVPCLTGARRLAKVGLVVELVCDYSQSPDYAASLCRRMGVEPSEVTDFTHRTGQWPGHTEARTCAGRVHRAPFGKYWRSDPAADCAPKKCLHCGRITEQGDIAVADPWRLQNRWSNPGKTLVYVRNPDVVHLVRGANVELEPVSEADWNKSLASYTGRKTERARRALLA